MTPPNGDRKSLLWHLSLSNFAKKKIKKCLAHEVFPIGHPFNCLKITLTRGLEAESTSGGWNWHHFWCHTENDQIVNIFGQKVQPNKKFEKQSQNLFLGPAPPTVAASLWYPAQFVTFDSKQLEIWFFHRFDNIFVIFPSGNK